MCRSITAYIERSLPWRSKYRRPQSPVSLILSHRLIVMILQIQPLLCTLSSRWPIYWDLLMSLQRKTLNFLNKSAFYIAMALDHEVLQFWLKENTDAVHLLLTCKALGLFCLILFTWEGKNMDRWIWHAENKDQFQQRLVLWLKSTAK